MRVFLSPSSLWQTLRITRVAWDFHRVLGAETHIEFNSHLFPAHLESDQNTSPNVKNAFYCRLVWVHAVASTILQFHHQNPFLPVFPAFSSVIVPFVKKVPPFFFIYIILPLFIQFTRGIWASVSKSVSYVFPQRPVSFVNICSAAGI